MKDKLLALLNTPLVRSVLVRAARTFVQTFIAVLLAAPALSFSGPALKAAAVAGLAATLSMVHRLLDETKIPTLPDNTTPPPAAPAVAPGVAA